MLRLHEEAQRNVRHDEKSEDRQFVKGHRPIENGADRFFRYAEPAAVQAVYKFARGHKEKKHHAEKGDIAYSPQPRMDRSSSTVIPFLP